MTKLHSLEILSVKHKSGNWPPPTIDIPTYLNRVTHSATPPDIGRVLDLINKNPDIINQLKPEEKEELLESLELRYRQRPTK